MNTNLPRFRADVDATSTESDLRILRLTGELDVAGTRTLRRAAAETGARDLDLDLSRLTFIDAAGLGCLVELRNNRLSHGNRFTLHGVVSPVVRVFTLAGLAGLLNEPPPAPHTDGPAQAGASTQVSTGRQPACSHTGRLLWQSTMFAIKALVTFEPCELVSVSVIVKGDFSTPGSLAVLRGALSRLARFHAPIHIQSTAVTNVSAEAARLLHTHEPQHLAQPASTLPRPQTAAPCCSTSRVA